ncbi:MAG: hypothetical protein O7D30_08440 [Rickettsia endosymbiont of Ixodes persulcatus]|nr:hypothetical protein [Rickettsia endosymbiont of Ixodes persulcatus]
MGVLVLVVVLVLVMLLMRVVVVVVVVMGPLSDTTRNLPTISSRASI